MADTFVPRPETDSSASHLRGAGSLDPHDAAAASLTPTGIQHGSIPGLDPLAPAWTPPLPNSEPIQAFSSASTHGDASFLPHSAHVPLQGEHVVPLPQPYVPYLPEFTVEGCGTPIFQHASRSQHELHTTWCSNRGFTRNT